MISYITIKIWVETRRLIKKVCAETDEKMAELIHRLITAEAEKVGVETGEGEDSASSGSPSVVQ